MSDVFAYEAWPPRSEWGQAGQGPSPYDNVDFHVDLGCGTLPKGRIGVDRFRAPSVNVLADLDGGLTYAVPVVPGGLAGPGTLATPGLPFADSSIRSIISHHAFEHIGDGFLYLMEEVHRVLEPGGLLRVITPAFPSWSAVSDPDHRRYFMADPETGASTWDAFFVDDNGGSWLESFSVPYIGTAKFKRLELDVTAPLPPELQWTTHDAREMRIAMAAWK